MPLLLFIAIIALTVVTVLLFLTRHWLPFLAASAASAFDHQLHLTLAIYGIAFIIVQLALAHLIWRSHAVRKLNGRSHGWPAFEIVIMLLTGAVFLTLGIKGGALSVNQPKLAEPRTLQIEVTGMQFQWYYRYPGADGKFGQTKPELIDASVGNPLGLDVSDPAAHDDIVASQLVVPVNRPVELVLKSQDVVHSFFVPAMRLQMNAVPGLTTYASFTPTQPGTFEVVCSQLCGLGHYRMHGNVNVLSSEQFEKWLHSREHK